MPTDNQAESPHLAAGAPPAPGTSVSGGNTPGIGRRIFSLIYEGILLFGVVFIAGYLFSALTQFKGNPASPLRLGFQCAIFVAIGVYFVWCWRSSGQTLPMKTWKFRLVPKIGSRLSLARCWYRYGLAWLGPLGGVASYKVIVLASGFGMSRPSLAAFLIALPIMTINFAWAFFDRDRQFLHDRLAGTRLAMV